MQCNFKTICLVINHRIIRNGCVVIYIGCSPYRFPVSYVLCGIGTLRHIPVKTECGSGGAWVSTKIMIITGHYNSGFKSTGQEPQMWQRFFMKIAEQDDVHQQMLLLIRLRYLHFIKIDPGREK